MDGIHNIAGRRTIKKRIGGREYTLAPKVLAEYAEREAYILARRPDPLGVIRRHAAEFVRALPEDLTDEQREIAEKHLEASLRRLEEATLRTIGRAQFVSLAEDHAFDQSLHGLAWRLWRALRQDHPEIDSVQAALDLVERHGSDRLGELTDALDRSEEKDILGNSDSPAGAAGANRDRDQKTSTPSGGTSRGPGSTATSRKSTAGRSKKSTG